MSSCVGLGYMQISAIYEETVDTLQHTATHCNTLQHTVTHCNTLQHTATHCNILQHTATHMQIGVIYEGSVVSDELIDKLHRRKETHISKRVKRLI